MSELICQNKYISEFCGGLKKIQNPPQKAAERYSKIYTRYREARVENIKNKQKYRRASQDKNIVDENRAVASAEPRRGFTEATTERPRRHRSNDRTERPGTFQGRIVANKLGIPAEAGAELDIAASSG